MNESFKDKLCHYESLLQDMWNESVKYLGVLTVNLLIQRVIWEIALEYPPVQEIKYDSNGISFINLFSYMEKNPDFPVDDVFKKFISVYVSILAKLLGGEKAEEIEKMIKEELAFEKKER